MKTHEALRIIEADPRARTPQLDSAREIRLLTLRGPLVASAWSDLGNDIAWIAATLGAAPEWVSAFASDAGSVIDALDVTLGFGHARLAQIQLREGEPKRATVHTARGQLVLLQDVGATQRAHTQGSWLVGAVAAAKRSLAQGGAPVHLDGERSLEVPRLMA